MPNCGHSCTKCLKVKTTDVHSVLTEVSVHQVDCRRFQGWLIQCWITKDQHSIFLLCYISSLGHIYPQAVCLSGNFPSRRKAAQRKKRCLAYILCYNFPLWEEKGVAFFSHHIHACSQSSALPVELHHNYDERDIQCLHSDDYLYIVQTESDIILQVIVSFLYNFVFSLELKTTYFYLLIFEYTTYD